jgi:uncharacterized membrane protein YkoI
MKMKIITRPTLIIGLFAALAIPAFAEDKDSDQTVAWKDVPAAVQATITANASGGKVRKVETETENGATVYEAKVKSDDEKIEIEVAADGSLIESETKGLDLDDLPAAVQATINTHANGAKVGKIEEETEKGSTVYEAEVKTTDGKEIEIQVAPDGTFVKTEAENEDNDKDGDKKDDDDKDGK